MTKTPIDILENKSVLLVVESISVVSAGFLGLNQEIIYAISVLIFALLFGVIWATIKFRVRDEKILFANELGVDVLIIYDERNKSVVEEICTKYAAVNLFFKIFNISETVDGEDLKSKLESVDAVYCFWSEALNNNNEYLTIIKDWSYSYRAKPILLITESSDLTDIQEKAKSYLKKFRMVSTEDARDNLWLLLQRSIDRGNRFLKMAKIWKLLFVLALVVLAVSISIVSFDYYKRTQTMNNSLQLALRQSYSDLKEISPLLSNIYSENGYVSNDTSLNLVDEKRKITNAIKSYLLYVKEDIQNKIGSNLNITMWRPFNNDTLFNVIFERGLNKLPIQNSLAGCACETNSIVVWNENIRTGDPATWDIDTRQKTADWLVEDKKAKIKILGKEYYYYAESTPLLDFPRKGILCIGIKNPGMNNCHVICLDAIEKPNILSNNWLKEYILSLSMHTSQIPSSAFQIK